MTEKIKKFIKKGNYTKTKMFISKISTHTKLYGFNEFAFLVKMM